MLRVGICAALLFVAGCAAEPGRDFLVFFPTDDPALTPDASATVSRIAALARAPSAVRITVAGEADGGTAHDSALARARGEAVVAALVKDGIDPGRIEQLPATVVPGQQGLTAHKVVLHLIEPRPGA
jgi:hypothetical protein